MGRSDSRVAPTFNERVVAYNLRMRELTQSTTSIELWRHRGMWANWANLPVDGLHFTDEGHRRYFNSVRGSLVAAMIRLVGSVSLISCNYRNRRRFWWYRDCLSQSSSRLSGMVIETVYETVRVFQTNNNNNIVHLTFSFTVICSSQHILFGIPEPRALQLQGACRARAGRVPMVPLSRAACMAAGGRVPGRAVDWLRLVYGNA